MTEKIVTLCFVLNGNQVLLGMKKRGFGKDKWNGFGGKVAENESIENAARRELFEECGIKALSLEEKGEIIFEYPIAGLRHHSHVFMVKEYSGQPIESEEMAPHWFEISNIPYAEMWEDDKYWLELLLKRLPEGKKLIAKFYFEDDEKISNYKLDILPL